MTQTPENLPNMVAVKSEQQIEQAEPIRVANYQRDLHPTNLVLSAEDLREFTELLTEVNKTAVEFEYGKLDLSQFETQEQARRQVVESMPIEYRYDAQNGDSIMGLGIPRTAESEFPDDLLSFFASNSTFAQRTLNYRPLNTVDAFLSFAKPSLKIDVQTLPSNPTENRSVINVAGRDENWVISTAIKLDDFFKKRKKARPIIHRSGTYDYFIFLVFLPAIIWFLYKLEYFFVDWLSEQSVFLNVILGVYAFLFSLLFARFLFQYARWLFPPMEYYKSSRWKSFVHRGIAGLAASAIILGAIYDIAKTMFLWALR